MVKRVRKRIRIKLNEEDFAFAIHEGRNGISKQRNLHAHIVFSSAYQGKKLDIIDVNYQNSIGIGRSFLRRRVITCAVVRLKNPILDLLDYVLIPMPEQVISILHVQNICGKMQFRKKKSLSCWRNWSSCQIRVELNL